MMRDEALIARLAQDEATRERLINWARWSRTHRVSHTCYSAEGRYRPELLRGDELEDRSTPRLPPVDVRDALVVYRAVNPVHGFPTVFTLALAAEFIFRLDPVAFRGYLRRHGYPTRERDLADLVRKAVDAATNVLHRHP